VLLEDEHLLAIDKPAGVAVHGGSGVSFGVIEQLRQARPHGAFLELVHRLDKETSGILLLAKKRSALTACRTSSASATPARPMPGAGAGVWPAKLKVIDVALHKYAGRRGERHVRVVAGRPRDGRRSITLVKVAAGCRPSRLLDVTIKTGRTHQIRVHLAHRATPSSATPSTATSRATSDLPGEPSASRACSCTPGGWQFDHPASGERITLHAPCPSANTFWTHMTRVRAAST
jgi:23S rRNA pseudouridine955/2504/2580 synthase